MLLQSKSETRFTEKQQEEIQNLTNAAYDKGASDMLHIVMDTAISLKDQYPDMDEYVKFTLHLVESIRQSLQEAVEDSQKEEPHSLLISPSDALSI